MNPCARNERMPRSAWALALGALLVAAEGSPSLAATITWGTPTAISPVGDSIVITNGTLVNATNYSWNSTATRTVNGVAFVAQTTAPSGWQNVGFDALAYNDGNVGAGSSPCLASSRTVRVPPNVSPEIQRLDAGLR